VPNLLNSSLTKIEGQEAWVSAKFAELISDKECYSYSVFTYYLEFLHFSKPANLCNNDHNMNNNNNAFFKFLIVFILGFSAYFLIQNFTPLTLFDKEKSIITVQGLAQENVSNQLAEFSAGIEVIAPTKEQAVNNANQVVDQLLIAVKKFGIAEEDIQTNQVSVYQENKDPIVPLANPETMISEEIITGKTGDWRANTSISITLRNEQSALLKQESEELLHILNQSQANYVYGPNFRLDEQYVSEGELINSAVADARNKAETIAAKNQQKIVKILEIVENDVSYRSFYSKELAVNSDISATSLEPGSSTLSKTVVVTFQVK